MDQHDRLAQRFEAHRSHLRAVVYRMLGSLSEADDAVQEAWLRLRRSDTEGVENLGGWLTTVVARVSLNMLQSRKSRREEPLDARVPDPIVDGMALRQSDLSFCRPPATGPLGRYPHSAGVRRAGLLGDCGQSLGHAQPI